MRIVTRADFDSIVCAVLLYESLDIKEPVKWIEPSEIQKGNADIHSNDIIANLPYDNRCKLWFDHHYSNRINTPFDGAFSIEPSAARVIFDHYKDQFQNDYTELVKQADKIDSADLSKDEVLAPENYPYILLSMTITSSNRSDEPSWNRLVELLRKNKFSDVMNDAEINARCKKVVEQNKLFKDHLLKNTKMHDHVAVSDFRAFKTAPNGNRFLAYSLFPESVVSVKIRCDYENRKKIILSVGHSIFNRKCNVNVGLLLSNYSGGGHFGAGACHFNAELSDTYIPEIIDILIKNESNE